MVRAMPVRHRGLPVAIAAIALAGTGCYRVPEGKSAVSDVEVQGSHDVDEADITDRLATRESSRFLGLFPGLFFEYETFDRHALQRDLARVERFLRARGYYDARVQAARVVASGDKVRIYIEVEQGPLTTVESLFVFGATDDVREAIAHDVKKVLPLGSALDEDKLAESEKAALGALTSHGHAAAKVERSAEVDLATHKARVTFKVTPGRVVSYGKIEFDGLSELHESDVRRVFGVEEGQRYDSSQLDEARQALLDLGVFGNVEIIVDKEEGERTGIAPIVVKCEESKLRALVVGIGGEFDALKTDAHLIGGWQSSNFLGGLRKLDVRFKPGIVFYPTRLTTPILAPDKPLYEHRLNATLRQPAFLEKRLTAIGYAEYSVYPVLLPYSNDNKPSENVLGYHELRGEVGVERPFFGTKLLIAPRYGVQANFPFDYIGQVKDISDLRISYFELNASLDLRDDPLHPRKGIWLGTELQRAEKLVLGDADDVRIQPEVRGYVPLHKKVVLALRSSFGFLFPLNYREDERLVSEGGSPSAATRDYQILFFRGFFAGGPTSNRGYPLRGIGPYDVIPFLSPAGQGGSANCDLGGNIDPNKPPECKLPTGGLSLWEANVEVRYRIAELISIVGFCDTADVSPRRVDFRFDRPHLSCGAGGRYDTPVGPVRFDVGYRIPGAQYAKDEHGEAIPGDFLGAPLALSIAIGEAF